MSDTKPESIPAVGTTAVEADALLKQADAMLKEQEAALHRLAAAREAVEKAGQRLAEGDGRDASAALRQALRDLAEDPEGRL